MLSLWVDLDSAFAFSYGGLHAEALAHGREWMVKPAWPAYVLWWVGAGHTPTWREAVARHLQLHDNGPSSDAFSFKSPFYAAGQATGIDRVKVKEIPVCTSC